jgi:Flp pilus assembly protein TadB
VSKERARRRAARQAEASQRAAEAARRTARQVARRRRLARWRVAARSALPWRPGQRWSRRTRTQRAAVAGVLLGVLIVTWLLTPSWSIRIAMLLVVLIASPALVTMLFDRSSR